MLICLDTAKQSKTNTIAQGMIAHCQTQLLDRCIEHEGQTEVMYTLLYCVGLCCAVRCCAVL